MNPAPGLLSDWITIPGFPITVLLCILAACLVILGYHIREVLREDREDAQDEWDNEHQDDIDRYHCAGHGCQLRTFYSDAGGTTWVCVNCERSYWVPVADVPYDQEASA